MYAIVLSRRNFREFDQIISFYTYDEGKIELLARGIKKIVSKHAAQVEPFAVVDIDIAHGKEIDHLTKVHPIEYFSSVRSNLAKSLAAAAAVGMVDRLVEVHAPERRIFLALKSWLEYVASLSEWRLIFLDGFIVVLLHYLGFTPILEKCVVCGKSFAEITKESLLVCKKQAASPSQAAGASQAASADASASQAGFYFAGGGLVCASCRQDKQKIGEQVLVCGLKEVSTLQMLLKGDWRLIEHYELDPVEAAKVHRLVYEFALYHSEKKIPDWGYLPSVK